MEKKLVVLYGRNMVRRIKGKKHMILFSLSSVNTE